MEGAAVEGAAAEEGIFGLSSVLSHLMAIRRPSGGDLTSARQSRAIRRRNQRRPSAIERNHLGKAEREARVVHALAKTLERERRELGQLEVSRRAQLGEHLRRSDEVGRDRGEIGRGRGEVGRGRGEIGRGRGETGRGRGEIGRGREVRRCGGRCGGRCEVPGRARRTSSSVVLSVSTAAARSTLA